MNEAFFIGCDVGSGSVRAGIFNDQGTMVANHTHPIKIWRPEPDFVEQSSEDIWNACCKCFNRILEKSNIQPENVQGVGFDATCSLVVLGKDDQPLSVNPDGKKQQNIIMWMDHRAVEQANYINNTNHEVLKYVGGSISPEMQTPKLLWLKQHKPDVWSNAVHFFDLADFLVYKATGVNVRSLCTTTCKWIYQGYQKEQSESSIGWDDSYFNAIGLDDLVEEDYRRIGHDVQPVGEPAGEGLTKQASQDLGLKPGTAVGVAMIDAHAGGIGLLGMQLQAEEKEEINYKNRFALIGGTSSCHMAVSQEPNFIDGVWGPYYSAMLPGMWLNEGGQSATGALIDHIIFSSKKSDELKKQAEKTGKTVYQLLNERLDHLKTEKGLTYVDRLTQELHLLPYFHGNRSPRADPNLTGSICGLKLSSTLDDLAQLYLAVIQAVAYGTRHIIEALNINGYNIDTIVATGGGTKNSLFLQQHANICGCNIILPKEEDAVLLGSAILGAVASRTYSDIYKAMDGMNKPGEIINPQTGNMERYHARKYHIFKKMYKDEMSYKKIMENNLDS